MATMQDPEFVAEIEKRHLTIEPLSGEDVQKMVAARATAPTSDPAPYCTDKPTTPPAKKSGDFFVF